MIDILLNFFNSDEGGQRPLKVSVKKNYRSDYKKGLSELSLNFTDISITSYFGKF